MNRNSSRRNMLSSVVGVAAGGTGLLLLSQETQAGSPSVAEFIPGYFNVQAFKQSSDPDDTNAINRAIQAATSGPGNTGSVIYFPPGVYTISSTITLPNRIMLKGPNGRGATIEASTSFTDPYMFYARNGTTSMFGSRIEDLAISFNDLDIPDSAVIRADAWQETCGLQRVLLQKFRHTGLLISEGHGGAAYLSLKDIEVFGSINGSSHGILVNRISRIGLFILSIDGASICGGANNPLQIGISVIDSLIARGIHFENVDTGIYLSGGGVDENGNAFGSGAISLDTITDSPNRIKDMLHIGPSFNGAVVARNLLSTGGPSGTSIIRNDVNGDILLKSAKRIIPEYVFDNS